MFICQLSRETAVREERSRQGIAIFLSSNNNSRNGDDHTVMWTERVMENVPLSLTDEGENVGL